jgi:hypothetical protein
MTEYIYKNYIEEVAHIESWGAWYETSLNSAFYDSAIGKAMNPYWGAPNFKNCMVNAHNGINSNEFKSSGTKTGPWLMIKMYNKQGELLKLDSGSNVCFISPTAQGSGGQDIYFQLYPRYLYFQKGGQSFYSTPGNNVLELETVDLRQNQWTTQTDIIKKMVFFIVGGLTYRSVNFGIDAQGANFLLTEDEPASDDAPTKYGTNEKVQTQSMLVWNEDGTYSKVVPQLACAAHLDYDYYDVNGESLINLNYMSSPMWINPSHVNDDDGNTPPPTGEPTGAPGVTEEPGSTGSPGGSIEDNSGHKIPGQYGLMLKYTVNVYEKGKKNTSNPLATLVSFNMGSPTFDFATPEPSATPLPNANIELVFDDTSNVIMRLADGTEKTISRSDLSNAEIIIEDDDGSFSTRNMGGLSSSTSGLALLKDADGNIKSVILIVSGRLSTDTMEITISNKTAVTDCKTEFKFIDNTEGAGSMGFTNNADSSISVSIS